MTALPPEIALAWQVVQTVLVLAMLLVLWRLHRRLDALRAARNEAADWLARFSEMITKTETLLRQVRQQAAAPPRLQPNEVDTDVAKTTRARPDGGTTPGSERPASAGGASAGPAGGSGGNADRLNRLEEILGRLR
jgi:hypothetical protein